MSNKQHHTIPSSKINEYAVSELSRDLQCIPIKMLKCKAFRIPCQCLLMVNILSALLSIITFFKMIYPIRVFYVQYIKYCQEFFLTKPILRSLYLRSK